MKFDAALRESVRVHGHRCAGRVLGVRMYMLGSGRSGFMMRMEKAERAP
jgi:formylmethanofuran dehydrogenase subunit E